MLREMVVDDSTLHIEPRQPWRLLHPRQLVLERGHAALLSQSADSLSDLAEPETAWNSRSSYASACKLLSCLHLLLLREIPIPDVALLPAQEFEGCHGVLDHLRKN